jgi:5-methylcytosine-specific restriction endonuclease McrA
LEVHHTDHDRENNDESNLVTLCQSCHLAHHLRGEAV